MSINNFLVFDIETGPLDEKTVLSRSKPFKKPDKIPRGKTLVSLEENYQREVLDKAALNAETGEVLAIGLYGNTKDGMRKSILEGVEQEMIKSFWDVFERNRRAGKQLVGFNILHFDMPFLIRRSWYLGVKTPKAMLDKGKWWSSTFVDLKDFWKLGEYKDSISLDTLAKCCGLLGKPTGVSGKDFARLWRDDKAAAIEYLHNDVELTWKLGVRLGAIDDNPEAVDNERKPKLD